MAISIQDGFSRHFRTGKLLDGLVHFYQSLRLEERRLVAEIGCAKGESSEVAVQYCDRLLCVENWGPGFEAGRSDFFGRMACYHNWSLLRIPSVDAAGLLADGILSGAYIDAMHDYPNVKADIQAWIRKIRPGGWIGGHDYDFYHPGHVGVVEAVNELLGGPQERFPDDSWLVRL